MAAVDAHSKVVVVVAQICLADGPASVRDVARRVRVKTCRRRPPAPPKPQPLPAHRYLVAALRCPRLPPCNVHSSSVAGVGPGKASIGGTVVERPQHMITAISRPIFGGLP